MEESGNNKVKGNPQDLHERVTAFLLVTAAEVSISALVL